MDIGEASYILGVAQMNSYVCPKRVIFNGSYIRCQKIPCRLKVSISIGVIIFGAKDWSPKSVSTVASTNGDGILPSPIYIYFLEAFLAH